MARLAIKEDIWYYDTLETADESWYYIKSIGSMGVADFYMFRSTTSQQERYMLVDNIMRSDWFFDKAHKADSFELKRLMQLVLSSTVKDRRK